MMIDSHAHLNFSEFQKELPEIVQRCREKDIRVVNVGSRPADSEKAVELAGKYDIFYAAVGFHPGSLGRPAEAARSFRRIKELVDQPETVAVGEIGLDYYWPSFSRPPAGPVAIRKTKEMQEEFFIRQLDLAEAKGLPVIIHCRGAVEDRFGAYNRLWEIVSERSIAGVIHCFGGSWELAEKFLDCGFYLGFTGIVTFKKKAELVQEVVRKTPLEKILVETDSPDLAPEPYRGRINQPIYLEPIIEKIAELKEISFERLAEATAENAVKLFKLKI